MRRYYPDISKYSAVKSSRNNSHRLIIIPRPCQGAEKVVEQKGDSDIRIVWTSLNSFEESGKKTWRTGD